MEGQMLMWFFSLGFGFFSVGVFLVGFWLVGVLGGGGLCGFFKVFAFYHSHKKGIIVILILILAKGTSLSISEGDRKPALHLESIVSWIIGLHIQSDSGKMNMNILLILSVKWKS